MDVPISHLVNVTDDRLTVRYFMIQEQATARRPEADFTVNIPHLVYSAEEAARLWHHHGDVGEIEIIDQDRMIIGEHVAPEWAGLMLTELGAAVFDESYHGFEEETLFMVPISLDPASFLKVSPPVNMHARYDFLTRPTALANTPKLIEALKSDGISALFMVRIGATPTFFDAAYFPTQTSPRFPVVGTPIDAPGQFTNTIRPDEFE